MADISAITLPSGSSYNLKDSVARNISLPTEADSKTIFSSKYTVDSSVVTVNNAFMQKSGAVVHFYGGFKASKALNAGSTYVIVSNQNDNPNTNPIMPFGKIWVPLTSGNGAFWGMFYVLSTSNTSTSMTLYPTTNIASGTSFYVDFIYISRNMLPLS